MSVRFSAPKGTHDIWGERAERFVAVEAAFRAQCRRWGYGEIRTPIFEDTELFLRTTGADSEIVRKQMYTFPDRAGRSLTLRPEGTPSVVRAYLEQGLGARGGVAKFHYIAPIFRYERPQAGRFRQHTQIGVEVLGAPGPDVDAEVIALYVDLLAQLGLEGAQVRLNSIGCPRCRPHYLEALRGALAEHLGEMCEFCQERFAGNTLRILDCKQRRCRELTEAAPAAVEFLCEECASHFSGLRELLGDLGIPYELEPRIVRGLDYYTRTVFEVAHARLGAQDALAGGGRYDGLAEALGGPHVPGVGFGAGLERLLTVLSVQAKGAGPADREAAVYVAVASESARRPAFRLVAELRRAGMRAEADALGRSLRAQMREAARLGARWALLLGEEELAQAAVTLRDMVSGDQHQVARDEVAQTMLHALAGNT